MSLEVTTLTKDDLESLLIRASKHGARLAMHRTQTPELMTREQLSAYISWDVSTISRAMRRKDNPLPFVMLDKSPRYRKDAIDRWLSGERFQEIPRETDNA